MSYRLPAENHPARDHFDMPSLAEALHPANVGKLPGLHEAIRTGRRAIANSGAGIKPRGISLLCMRADDDRLLIHVGPRGGWKLIWNFGDGRN